MVQNLEQLVVKLLEHGNRADAIDVYRDRTGALPSEANRAVDNLARLHGWADTLRFADVVLILLIAGSLALGFLLP